jgi:hypothetical protein
VSRGQLNGSPRPFSRILSHFNDYWLHSQNENYEVSFCVEFLTCPLTPCSQESNSGAVVMSRNCGVGVVKCPKSAPERKLPLGRPRRGWRGSAIFYGK